MFSRLLLLGWVPLSIHLSAPPSSGRIVRRSARPPFDGARRWCRPWWTCSSAWTRATALSRPEAEGKCPIYRIKSFFCVFASMFCPLSRVGRRVKLPTLLRRCLSFVTSAASVPSLSTRVSIRIYVQYFLIARAGRGKACSTGEVVGVFRRRCPFPCSAFRAFPF